MAKVSGMRRCVRSGAGACAASSPSNSGHSFALKFLCSLGNAKHDYFSQHNTNAALI